MPTFDRGRRITLREARDLALRILQQAEQRRQEAWDREVNDTIEFLEDDDNGRKTNRFRH